MRASGSSSTNEPLGCAALPKKRVSFSDGEEAGVSELSGVSSPASPIRGVFDPIAASTSDESPNGTASKTAPAAAAGRGRAPEDKELQASVRVLQYEMSSNGTVTGWNLEAVSVKGLDQAIAEAQGMAANMRKGDMLDLTSRVRRKFRDVLKKAKITREVRQLMREERWDGVQVALQGARAHDMGDFKEIETVTAMLEMVQQAETLVDDLSSILRYFACSQMKRVYVRQRSDFLCVVFLCV